MRFYKPYIYLFFAITIVPWSCSTDSQDDFDPTERTYPQAYDFETVTIPELKNKVTPPDSVNIEAYVVERIYCPPDVFCVGIIADHIIVSETPDSDKSGERLWLTANNPLQFKTNQLYVISLQVNEGDSGTIGYLRILGYSN